MSDFINTNNSAPSAILITALVISGASGVGIFLCMPVIASALADVFGFSTKQVGNFSFIQLVSMSVGSIAALFVTNRFSVRTLLFASLCLLVVMDFLSAHLPDYDNFLIARGIAGMAGGAVITVATGALSQLPGTERNFGFFLFTQITISIIGILLMPQLVTAFGIKGVFYSLVALELVTIVFLVRHTPASTISQLSSSPTDDPESSSSKNTKAAWIYCAIALLGILAFFFAIGSFWTFVGLIGQQSGLDAETVGKALSFAGIGGILGSMVPIFAQQKLGSGGPLLVAFVVMLGAIYLVSNQTTTLLFTLAAILFLFGWYIYNPYQLAVLSNIDRDGRPAMVSAVLTSLGLGGGPAVVSLVGGQGFSAVYSVATTSLVLSIVILLFVVTTSKRALAK